MSYGAGVEGPVTGMVEDKVGLGKWSADHQSLGFLLQPVFPEKLNEGSWQGNAASVVRAFRLTEFTDTAVLVKGLDHGQVS